MLIAPKNSLFSPPPYVVIQQYVGWSGGMSLPPKNLHFFQNIMWLLIEEKCNNTLTKLGGEINIFKKNSWKKLNVLGKVQTRNVNIRRNTMRAYRHWRCQGNDSRINFTVIKWFTLGSKEFKVWNYNIIYTCDTVNSQVGKYLTFRVRTKWIFSSGFFYYSNSSSHFGKPNYHWLRDSEISHQWEILSSQTEIKLKNVKAQCEWSRILV